MPVDLLGTGWDQCVSMVQYSFTSTETSRLVRTDSWGRPLRLSHSSWTMNTDLICIQAYLGLWFQNGGGSRKTLVCDSIRPSGIDLYYTGLPASRYARETLLLLLSSFFLFSCTTVFVVEPHVVCPFGMADWLNRLRAFIIHTVFLIRKKCKKNHR